MDISAVQHQILAEMKPPVEEPIDNAYIASLGHVIKQWVYQYAANNPTKRMYFWADYLGTGLKKPSYNELRAVGRYLRTQFTNMEISIETVLMRVKVSGNLVPRWNRLRFRW